MRGAELAFPDPPSSVAIRPKSALALLQRPRPRFDRGLRRDPVETGQLVAGPGELALGVMAGIEFGAFRRFGERKPPFEMGDEMGDAVGAHDRQGRVELSRREPA